MQLIDATRIADELLDRGQGPIGKHTIKYTICGSIRRQKEVVKDIDIVCTVKKVNDYHFGSETFDQSMERISDTLDGKKQVLLRGQKIKRFIYKGIAIDIYIGDDSTYETLVLIRTGSQQFNENLASKAKSLNMILHASGKGLWLVDPAGNDIKLISNTEKGIIEYLRGQYIEPKDRFG